LSMNLETNTEDAQLVIIAVKPIQPEVTYK